jgi:hypothetical protein
MLQLHADRGNAWKQQDAAPTTTARMAAAERRKGRKGRKKGMKRRGDKERGEKEGRQG